MIEIRLFKDQNLKGYTFIEGFPGAGLVGPMASSYMIEKLGMEYVGYLNSDLFPPIAAVHGGIPMYTARIYVDRKNKLVLVFSEFTIPSAVVSQLGNELLSFIRKSGIARIISIGGMPSQKQSKKAFIISPDSDIVKKAAKQGISQIKEGVIAGVSAVLLTKARDLDIPVLNLLVEVNPIIMNPEYAEIAIAGLRKLIGLKIDLSELEAEAKEVSTKVRDILKKAKDSHESYSKATDVDAAGQSMYA